ncbi:hypothetical protein DFS34DRAFT_682950 [Phlyctochytrium arcticum]|nr:hypothetical protein DFS34DRAFT_682950 [Phlyctochytrium arcticum]
MLSGQGNDANSGSFGSSNTRQGSSFLERMMAAQAASAQKRRRTESQSDYLESPVRTRGDTPAAGHNGTGSQNPFTTNPPNGILLSRDQVTNILTRRDADRSLTEAGHHFATKSLGEQLLTLFLDIQEMDRRSRRAEDSEYENWEISPNLKILTIRQANIKGEAKKSCMNAFKKSFTKDSKPITDLIFDDGLGVSPQLKSVTSVYQTVQTAVGVQLTQAKNKMKSALVPKGTKVSNLFLDDLVVKVYGKEYTPEQRTRTAILRWAINLLTAKGRSSSNFWESVSNVLKQFDGQEPEALARDGVNNGGTEGGNQGETEGGNASDSE